MHSRPETLFWDVDTQVDFMLESGALYVPGAEEIIPALARLTKAARRAGIPVVASADDHELTDAEISDAPDFATTYPPHCMRGNPGQEKIPATRLPATVRIGHDPLPADELRQRVADARQALVILKKHFDVFTNPNTEPILDLLQPRRIVLYGVALDVCNRAAVEGLWQRGHRHLTVVTDATRALDRSRGKALLADWQDRGVHLATTDEVLDGLPDLLPVSLESQIPREPPSPREAQL